jgi:two-component system nitrate/nitrite response regulator NarL
MITVLLVDDHVPIQRGLRYMLEATQDIEVIATASNGVEAVAEARRHCPDVVVMDISMPVMDGIEATRQIREFCRFSRVMMLSILDNPEYIQRAVEVGAVGFVLKETIGLDLLAAVRALARGKRYFSRKIAQIAEAYFDEEGGESWAG